ncbi:hypothetical protein P7H12_12755 [Paenibacillus larvae]|nr:hypothetical protein [Paenibacillus larvae]MDT2264285.1 hypothetical protein [Paenibacillus larvae]
MPRMRRTASIYPVWQFFSALVTGGKVIIYPNERDPGCGGVHRPLQRGRRGDPGGCAVPNLSVLLEHLERSRPVWRSLSCWL